MATLFATEPDPCVKLQHSAPLGRGDEAFMGIEVPYLYFAYQRSSDETWHSGKESTLKPTRMRDFSGRHLGVPPQHCHE